MSADPTSSTKPPKSSVTPDKEGIQTLREQKESLAVTDNSPLYANRVKVHPKDVKGIARNIKTAILIFCLALYYIGPWLRWDRGPGVPDQAILLDMEARRAYLFNIEIWPQEIYFLTGLLILGALALFLVTSMFGRLWCGYACPQSVWTDLFMMVERVIEGDRSARMRLDKQPMSGAKFAKRLAKHIVWLIISVATGGAWIFYYSDAPTLLKELLAGQGSTGAYFFLGLFTATTYLLAGWAREQVCTYMCPWPRFQAAMCDEHTYNVTYQAWRGEKRGPHKAGTSWEGRGDCIDCRQCVAACPTGIDIRDGSQIECINCGLCIDACNEIMDKVERPRWLITWDSLASQNAKEAGNHGRHKLIRARTLIYMGVMTLGVVGMLVAFSMRAKVEVNVLRDRAPLFVTLADGGIRNGYTVKILNKTREARVYTLSVAGLPELESQLQGQDGQALNLTHMEVVGDSVGTFRLFVRAPRPVVKAASTPLTLSLKDKQSGDTATYSTVFIGPTP